MTTEPISLFEQSKRCGENIGLIGVCTASIDAVNELLDFRRNWNAH